MTWRDLPQSAAQLREAGLSVISVHSPTHNVNSIGVEYQSNDRQST